MGIDRTSSDLDGRRTRELCLKTYGEKWCEMAFVIKRVFYYRRLKGCLQTGEAFAGILPTGGGGSVCSRCVSSPIRHSESPLRSTCHGPLSLLDDFIGVYLVAVDKSFADRVWPGPSTCVEHHLIPLHCMALTRPSHFCVGCLPPRARKRLRVAVSECLSGRGCISLHPPKDAQQCRNIC